MSWGTDFTTNIFLSNMTFPNGISDVEQKIKENENRINILKQQVQMFVSATPSDIIPKDWNEDPIIWLNNQIEDLFEDIEELLIRNVRLQLYVEHLESDEPNKIFVDFENVRKLYQTATVEAYLIGKRDENLDDKMPVPFEKADVIKLLKIKE